MRAKATGISSGSVSSQRTVRLCGEPFRPPALGKRRDSQRCVTSPSLFGPWLKSHAQEEPGMEWLKQFSSGLNQARRTSLNGTYIAATPLLLICVWPWPFL
eukprot:4652278-Amphidinium_carterae.1